MLGLKQFGRFLPGNSSGVPDLWSLLDKSLRTHTVWTPSASILPAFQSMLFHLHHGSILLFYFLSTLFIVHHRLFTMCLHHILQFSIIQSFLLKVRKSSYETSLILFYLNWIFKPVTSHLNYTKMGYFGLHKQALCLVIFLSKTVFNILPVRNTVKYDRLVHLLDVSNLHLTVFFFLWVVVYVPLSTVFLCSDCHQHEDMKCIWCLVCLEPFCGNFVKRVVVLSYVWLNNNWKMGSIYFPGSPIFNVWWAIILSKLNNNFKAVLYDTYSLGCVKKRPWNFLPFPIAFLKDILT